MLERLHKVLARAGVAALRPAEDMIMAGRVTVNGRVVRELGARVDPDTDQIAVDGMIIDVPQPSDPHRYVLLHKPAGVISTAQDTHGRQTVVDLIPSDERLFPVGRLDADSEGLILLTNDGDLAYRLTHPRFEVEKEYRVLLDRTPDVADLRRWREGVELDGEMTLPVWAELLERTPNGTWVRIVMREGRNRQIRNVAQLLGYDVQRLIRVREGALSLGDLAAGEWRELTAADVDALRAHVRHIPSPDAEQRSDERAPERERAVRRDQHNRGPGDTRRARPAFGDRSRPTPDRRPRAAVGERRADDPPRTPLSDRRSDDRPRSIRDVGRRSTDRSPARTGDRRAAGPQRDRAPWGSRDRTGGQASRYGSSNSAQRDRRTGGAEQRDRSGSSIRSGLGRSSQSTDRRNDGRDRSGSSMRSGLGRSGDRSQRSASDERGRGPTRPGSPQRSSGPRTDRPSSGGRGPTQRPDRSAPARGGGYRSEGGNARGNTPPRGNSGAGRPQREGTQRSFRTQRTEQPARSRSSDPTRRPPGPRRDDEE